MPTALSPYALIGIDTLKLALMIEPDNTTEDEVLTYLVNMATQRVEQDAHRPLRWRDHYIRHFDGMGQPDLLLPLYPITAVTAIRINGGDPLGVFLVDVDADPPDGWRVAIYARSGRAHYASGWPQGVANIRAEWAGGYGAPPPPVAALRDLLTGRFEWRTSTLGAPVPTNKIAVDVAFPDPPTSLAVSTTALGNVDVTLVLGEVRAGDSVLIQEKTDSTKFYRLSLLGPGTIVGGTAVFPVALLEQGASAIGNNQEVLTGWTLAGQAIQGAPIPEDLQEATVLMAADGYQTRKTATWNAMSLSLQGQSLNLSPDLLWRRYRSCVNPYRDIPL